MSKKRTDTQRLDALQKMASFSVHFSLTTGYGRGWILRDSKTGRGIRLHETSRGNATFDVRKAIDNYLDEFL